MLGVDVVERLHHWAPQLLRHPTTLGRTSLDGVDATVALLRVIVAGIHHHEFIRRSLKQIVRQRRDALLRDGDDDQILSPRCVPDCNSPGSRFASEPGERSGTARVGYGNLVPQSGEPPGESATNMPRTDDADLHFPFR